MNKEAAHNRLLQAIEYLKDNGKARSHEEISDLSGISRSNVTSAINGNARYVTEGNLRRFVRAYSDYINEDWLLTGEGQMEKPDKNTRPHFPATVEAGVLAGDAATVMDYEVDMEPMIKRFPDYDYMIDVSGRSMEPTYFDGDSVACRRVYDSRELTPGKVYVIATRDGAVIKRFMSSTLSSIRVASDNPEYKPYNIDHDSILSIAEVVGSIHINANSEWAMRDALLKYVESVLADTSISDAERKEIINLIMNRN